MPNTKRMELMARLGGSFPIPAAASSHANRVPEVDGGALRPYGRFCLRGRLESQERRNSSPGSDVNDLAELPTVVEGIRQQRGVEDAPRKIEMRDLAEPG